MKPISRRTAGLARRRERPPGGLRALMGVAAVLVLTAAGCALTGGGEDGRTPASRPDEGARYLRLDDGRSGTVALSSARTVKVWWRDRNQVDWSAPAEVDAGPGQFLTYTRARVLGNTLAIRAFYTDQQPGDDEATGRGTETSRFVICRARACVASDYYEHVQDLPCRAGSCETSRPEGEDETQVPELGTAGGQVYFGSTEHGYAVWSAGDGLRELVPQGLPRPRLLGAPLMSPDGSMRVVAGRDRDGACRLTLFTSDPIRNLGDTVEFTRQATTSLPTTSGRCGTTLEAFDDDQLLIHTDRERPAYLERLSTGWTPTSEDPTGMIRYDSHSARGAEGAVERTGYWHWREVVAGSPDGRRLEVQVRFPDAAEWTVPKTVAEAPAGATCRDVVPTSTPSQDPFYVSMTCRTPGAPEFGIQAVTEDGYRWRTVTGDPLPSRVGDDLWFGGSPAHGWTAGKGVSRLRLEVPARSRTFLVEDGSVVLVTAQPVRTRCRLVVRVAEDGARRWSAPLPNADPLLPRTAECAPAGQEDGRVVRLYVPTDRGTVNTGTVTRHDGAWVVEQRG